MGFLGSTGPEHYGEGDELPPSSTSEDRTSFLERYHEEIKKSLFSIPLEDMVGTFDDLEKSIQGISIASPTAKELATFEALVYHAKAVGYAEVCRQINVLAERNNVAQERVLFMHLVVFAGHGFSMNFDACASTIKSYLELCPNGLTKLSRVFDLTEEELLACLETNTEQQIYEELDIDEEKVYSEAQLSMIRSCYKQIRQLVATRTPDLDLLRKNIDTLREYYLLEEFIEFFEAGKSPEDDSFLAQVTRHERSEKKKFLTYLASLKSTHLSDHHTYGSN